MPIKQYDDTRAKAHALIDALADRDRLAVMVVSYLAERMLKGFETYGALDLTSRDWRKERGEEIADLLNYTAMMELRRLLGA